MNPVQKILLILLLVGVSTIVSSQTGVPDSLSSSFLNQLLIFPQEKIYLHTDKPYYIAGERIWFRAHLTDAATHIPTPVSRYVYVELINPLDTVVTRIKILQDEGAYHGHLLIPEDAPEGDYTIRAYTAYMRNLDEDYFCTKTVRIGDPQARLVQTDTRFFFEPGRRGRIHATFRFSRAGSETPLVPKSVRVKVNNGREMSIKVDADGSASFNFDLPAASRQRIILLEVVAFAYPYRQFIRVPTPDDDFDVSFYPEGGSIMQGAFGRVAFKAMKSSGQSTEISGILYERDGTEITKFHSEHLGMGSFRFLAEKGKLYYAVCENSKGQSKRFDLPAAADRGYSLTVSQQRDRIYVSTLQPADAAQNGAFYLLAHTRGLVHFAVPLNHEKMLGFRRDQFPSGVLHLILFDGGLNPVSERLMFINNQEDQAQVTYLPDQENYARRSLVKNLITLTDSNGEPLSGSFSVSVTSDREVTPDSTSSILTHLLLASDLHGNIENPAYYFQNAPASSLALDLLMLTHGWRRYDIAELAQGHFAQPTIPVEMFPEISGTVKRVTLRSRVENIDVTIVSQDGDYFGNPQTDKEGRFYLRGVDFPEGTDFIVHAVRRRGIAYMDLIMDTETFPARTLPVVHPVGLDRNRFANYSDKVEQMYTLENDMRIVVLPEVTVTASVPQKPARESQYYSSSFVSHVITQTELERFSAPNILYYLVMVPGVWVLSYNPPSVSIRGFWPGDFTPIFVVDDIVWDINDVVYGLPVSFIEQIDVLSGVNPFGMRGAGGAIVIFTKRGEDMAKVTNLTFNIKNIMPLGFQQPIEFYAPKYDTPEKRNAQAPDLRTTIHWQPVVQTDNTGVASFEFYTADEQSSYTVIIEGLADDGSIIRQEGKLWRRER